MKRLLKVFKENLHKKLLDIVWKQWSYLGVQGNINNFSNKIIDIESLFMFSCYICRYDPRLFDEMLDWINQNGSFINIQRLKNIISKNHYYSNNVLSAIAETISQKYAFNKWKCFIKKHSFEKAQSLFYTLDHREMPFFGNSDEIFEKYGLLRGKIEFTKKSKCNLNISETIYLKLRSLFGLNVRAEIISYLLAHSKAHPTQMSKDIFFSQKAVQDTLVEMVHSSAIYVHATNKEKYYYLNNKNWFELIGLKDKKLEWITWPIIYSILEQVHFKLLDDRFLDKSELLISSELRSLMNTIRKPIESAMENFFITDPQYYIGEEYIPVFISDIEKIINHI